MYNFTVWYHNNTYEELENVDSVRIGLPPTCTYFTGEEIAKLHFDDAKPIYLFSNNKSSLIPAKSFKLLTCESVD